MHNLTTRFLIAALTLTALSAYSNYAHAAGAVTFESPELRIKLTPRSPQQITAFYEARGFNKAMLDKIRQYCFITIYIKNQSDRIIWLDLTNWKFFHAGQTITRLDRNQLKKHWQAMAIPLAHQSIFRWTLLPEQLDFQAKEREGGNIVLPWTDNPITIQARFDTLGDKSGEPLHIKLENIQCQRDPA